MKLIQTKDYLLWVDDKFPEIGDWFYIDFTENVEQFKNTDYGEFHPHKMFWPKVIAHRPLNGAPYLDGVYVLPPLDTHSLEEAQQFALSHFKDLENTHPSGGKIENEGLFELIKVAVSVGYKHGIKANSPEKRYSEEEYTRYTDAYTEHLLWCLDNNKVDSRENWEKRKAEDFYKRGLHLYFKAASQDRKYSEEDLRDAFKRGQVYGISEMSDKYPDALDEDAYIQSLPPATPVPIAFEPEMEYKHPSNGKWYRECGLQQWTDKRYKTITLPDDREQLVGKYTY